MLESAGLPSLPASPTAPAGTPGAAAPAAMRGSPRKGHCPMIHRRPHLLTRHARCPVAPCCAENLPVGGEVAIFRSAESMDTIDAFRAADAAGARGPGNPVLRLAARTEAPRILAGRLLAVATPVRRTSLAAVAPGAADRGGADGAIQRESFAADPLDPIVQASVPSSPESPFGAELPSLLPGWPSAPSAPFPA